MEDLVDDLMEAIMMIRRTRMGLEVVVRTKGEIILNVSMMITIEIREEETKDKDLEEEATMRKCFHCR